MNTDISKIENMTMSSKEISLLTGKRHGHVLRDISKIINELKDDPIMDHLDFKEVFDASGYTKEFLLDQELTLILVSGYAL